MAWHGTIKRIEDSIGRAVEWVWRWLPDRCQMPDCKRKGIRGNEVMFGQMRMCRDCHEKLTRKRWQKMWEKPFDHRDLI